MAAITDLTWQELADEAPTGAIIVSGGKVMIDVGALTGDTLTALSDSGVVEALFKIRDAAGKAQVTVNAAANSGAGPAAGEALAAFPRYVYSTVGPTGNVSVTQSSSFVIPLTTSTVYGSNI